MTLDQVKNNPVFQTARIAEDLKDRATLAYIIGCLKRFYAGDYGTVPAEDTEANNNELEYGSGRLLARYEARHALKDDVYIMAYFDDQQQGIDFNNTMIMYCSDY